MTTENNTEVSLWDLVPPENHEARDEAWKRFVAETAEVEAVYGPLRSAAHAAARHLKETADQELKAGLISKEEHDVKLSRWVHEVDKWPGLIEARNAHSAVAVPAYARYERTLRKLCPDPTFQITQSECHTLIMGTLRYALGRRSYAVGETIEIIQKYWKRLTQAQRELILKDVSDWVFEKHQRWVHSEDKATTQEWVIFQTWMLENRT